MKTGKKLTAVVLMLVMMFSLMPVAQVNATKTEETQVDLAEKEIIVDLTVDAPYKSYFTSTISPYDVARVYINTEDALKDDFGIGLKNDGMPDVVEDGKGYISALRALAFFIRCDLMRRFANTWFTPEEQTDKEEYMKKLVSKANSEMSKYIKLKEIDPGSYNIVSLRDDEQDEWDQGLARAGVSPYQSSWMHDVNGIEADKYIGQTPIKNGEVLSLFLVPYEDGGDTGRVAPTSSGPESTYAIVGKEYKNLIQKETYDESWQKVLNPLPGAKFRVYNSEGVPADTILETDADGYLRFTPTEPGVYIFVGCDEYDDGQGNIYSKTDVGCIKLIALAPTPKAKSVKLTVTGKKKAKKKNIKVSFKIKDSSFKADFVTYNIYLSKKKKSGYKKVASLSGTKLSTVIKNKKKGAYFIKIQTVAKYEDNYTVKSGFTTPKKVVVK